MNGTDARMPGERFHVAIEAVGVKHSGGAHVLRRLVDTLLAREEIRALTLFVTPRPARRFELEDDERLELVELAWAEPVTGRVAWLEAGFARACATRDVDLAICFNGMGEAGHIPQVNFVQQAIIFVPEALATMPLIYQARMAVVRALSKSSCRRAQLVIAQTRTVRGWLLDQFKLSEDRVEVFTPDIDWLDAPLISDVAAKMRDVREDRRVLYVGSAMPYKSIGTAIEAAERIRQELRDTTLFMTLPQSHPANFEPGVVCLGTLNHAEVRVALESAALLVMPSLAETVGLPMLEACAVGCPVLAADLPYAHDVCGQAARYFRPGDPRACANALRRLLREDRTREQMAARGRTLHARLVEKKPYQQMVDAILATARRG